MEGGWRPTWEFWQQHNLLQDNRETWGPQLWKTVRSGRPGGRVLVLSVLLRDCVTSDRFPPLSGSHVSHLCNERSGFQTMLEEAFESQRGVSRGCFGGRGSRR